MLGTPTFHLPLSSIIYSTLVHIAGCYIYGIPGVNFHGQVIGMNRVLESNTCGGENQASYSRLL